MRKAFVLAATVALALIAGCEYMRESKPLLAQKEYEKMIVGRFDADYVGTTNCLASCHEHDKVRRDFDASTMGAQLSAATHLPLVDCESCHGPGSLAVEGLTTDSVAALAANGVKTACKNDTLIDIRALPAPAQSLICLKCHTANATFNLHMWSSGSHARADVSCSDCHDVHAGPDLIVRPREVYRMCLGCHEDVEAELSLPSHHPVLEQKIICTDCHNPHGGNNEYLLNKYSAKDLCAECHPEKQGPFVFEHADLTEDCTTCHRSHGSENDSLLTEGQPFLCLQCHNGHPAPDAEHAGSNYTRCTDCHSQIHGTDVPSASGRGRLTQ